MKKLKLDEAINLHREMWTELAETGGLKEDTRVIRSKKYNPWNDCFLCEIMGTYDMNCREGCLMEWGTDTCTSAYSPYLRWVVSRNGVTAKKFAREISELEINWNVYNVIKKLEEKI